MNDHDLPSDSDDSDVDYIPTGKEGEGLSEEDSGQESDEKNAENETDGALKRKKSSKKSIKKKKVDTLPVEEEVIEKETSEVDKKKKADALWADFMKDCGHPKAKSTPASEAVKTDTPSSTVEEKENKSQPEPKPKKVKITEIFDFAGEKVSVEKEVDVSSSKAQAPQAGARGGRGRGGLSSVLSHLGKAGKLSTLEKSKLDWEKFKTDQGIKEDIEKHNKGKNGFLEKQDFLERADLRQFEIEKEMRSKTRRTLNR